MRCLYRLAIRGGLRLVLPVMLLFGAVAPSVAALKKESPGVVLPQPLRKLIADTLARNPLLTRIRYSISAAKELIPQAGTFPDPMLTISLMNVPLDTRGTPMSGLQVGLMQTFPFYGKRGLRRDVKRHAYWAKRHLLAEAANRLRAQVVTGYYRLLYLKQAQAITRKNQRILVELLKYVQSKYGLGMGHQADVLKAQVAVTRLDNRLIILKQRVLSVTAELNAMRKREHTEPIGTPPQLTLVQVDTSFAALKSLLVAHNPRLKSRREQVLTRRMALKLAKRSYYPDFTVGFAYRFRLDHPMDSVRGADFISLVLKFNLPVFHGSKLDPAVRQSHAGIRAALASYDADELKLLLVARKLQLHLERLAAQLRLHQAALLPQARQALSAARLGYQSGKIDFLTVLSNQLVLFNLELQVEGFKTRYRQVWAQLEWIVGREGLK